MQYTKPSSKNPGLIVFVLDVSKSMKDSQAHNDIIQSLPYLRSLGLKKPQTIKFCVIQFAFEQSKMTMPLEYADIYLEYKLGGATDMPRAIDLLQNVVSDHIKTECSRSNPLINILFFTDGRSTPSLMKNSSNVSSRLDNLIDKENIMFGIIDYDEISPLDELPSENLDIDGIYKFRVARASVLPKKLVETAYKVEKQSPPVTGTALEKIFGPSKNLINKQLILSSKTVNRHPNVTTAFIKLGTFTVAEGLETTRSSNFKIREREEYDV
tara:strand:+ start:110 stop:916 length:807 start_codon:yes stop_codon:yes gene_type:complete